MIEVWEAAATFLLFPILMLFAYVTDKNWCKKNVDHSKHQLDLSSVEDQSKHAVK